MRVADLVEREIARNEGARNGMILFGVPLAAAAAVVWAVGNPMWPLVAGVAVFFLLIAAHSEHLRRRLIRDGREKLRERLR